MLLRILKMGQIDLFVGGRPWLALASGYLEQKDCLYIGSAKFCPGGHVGDNFHATSAGARKIKEEHHVTDGTWSNLGIAAVPGLRDIKMPQVALTLKLQEVPGNSGRLEMLNLLTLWFPRVDMVWPLHEHSNQLTTSNLFVGSKKTIVIMIAIVNSTDLSLKAYDTPHLHPVVSMQLQTSNWTMPKKRNRPKMGAAFAHTANA